LGWDRYRMEYWRLRKVVLDGASITDGAVKSDNQHILDTSKTPKCMFAKLQKQILDDMLSYLIARYALELRAPPSVSLPVPSKLSSLLRSPLESHPVLQPF